MTRRNFRGDRGRCQTWVRGSKGEPTQDWTFRGLSRFTGETRGRWARRYLPALELQRGLCRPQASGAPGNRLTSCHERGEGGRGGTQGCASSPAWSSAQGTRRRPCSGRPPRKRPEDALFSPGPLRLVPVALSRADVPRRGEAQRLSRSLRLIPGATLQGCVERRAAWGSP